MLLAHLPSNSRVFCDANVLTYAFLGAGEISQACSALIERCARREIDLLTSSFQAAHTIHRIMAREAAAQFNLEASAVVTYLKRHPHLIPTLQEYKRIPGLRLWTPD